MVTPVIETERFTLRELKRTDASALFKTLSYEITPELDDLLAAIDEADSKHPAL